MFYRDDYEKPATEKSFKTCFKSKAVMDRYLRQVVLVYAYTYQKVRTSPFDPLGIFVHQVASQKV